MSNQNSMSILILSLRMGPKYFQLKSKQGERGPGGHWEEPASKLPPPPVLPDPTWVQLDTTQAEMMISAVGRHLDICAI